MTIADDIAAFVVLDLPVTVTAMDLSPTRAVYAGQRKANIRKPASARVGFLRDVDLARDQGKVRHHFIIELHRYGMSKMLEADKVDQLHDAAKEVEDVYDGAVSKFNTGITTAIISRVRCFRTSPVDIVVRGASRQQDLMLEVDTWE